MHIVSAFAQRILGNWLTNHLRNNYEIVYSDTIYELNN